MWHCERVTFLSSIFRTQIFIHFGNFGHFCICLFICIDVFSYNSFCCNHIFRNSGNKDTNYMLAILDSRMKIVAHERFQYVLLKKFGKLPMTTFLSRYFITLCIITDLSKTSKQRLNTTSDLINNPHFSTFSIVGRGKCCLLSVREGWIGVPWIRNMYSRGDGW